MGKPDTSALYQDTVAAAREALGAGHGYDAASLAARCGALEYHLDALLRLAGELSRNDVNDDISAHGGAA